MVDFVSENIVFSILAGLFLIEQALYYLPGSLPYRLGLPISKRIFPYDACLAAYSRIKRSPNLAVRLSKNGDIYLRYRYGSYIGPLLFVGQVQKSHDGIMIIRVGLLTASFLIYLVASPLLTQSGLYRVLNSVVLMMLVVFLYSRFMKAYRLLQNALLH